MSITDEDVATLLFNELWKKNLQRLNQKQKQDLAIKLWDATLDDDLAKYKKFLETQNHKGLVTLDLVTENVQKLLKKKLKDNLNKIAQRSYDKGVEEEEAAAFAAAKRDNEKRLRKAADTAAKKLNFQSPGETKEPPLVALDKNQDDDDKVRTAIPYAHVYQPPGQPPAKPKKKSGFSCFPFCGNDDALDGGRKHKKRKTRKHKKRKTRKHKKRKIKKTRKHKKKKTKRKTRRKR